MPKLDNAGRWLQIKSPLAGANQLILIGLSGEEIVNGLYSFRLEMVSANADIKATDLIGKEVTFSVGSGESDRRFFHGLVSRMSSGGRIQNWEEGGTYFAYQCEVVPELWFLSHRVDSRIFQQMTTKQIIEEVLQKAGAKAPTKIPAGRTWEYCVQYAESDFDFIMRLTQEEGWISFFRHADGSSEWHVGEDDKIYFPIKIDPVKIDVNSQASNVVGAFDQEYRFRPTKWANEDYNFKTSATDLLTSTNADPKKKTGKSGQYEIYDFPGNYIKKGTKDGQGDLIAKRRIEALEASYVTAQGHGAVAFFEAGGYFTLEGHHKNDGKWVITSVRHAASGGGHYAGATGGDTYGNSFVVAPKETVLRPARTTPRPIIAGPQTAVVVGPPGEEINVDEYGRIHVQFHWDRLGKKDDKSSCWIRVAQSWAGAQWGSVFTPRVGMEVVVEHLHGDPDQPLITGCVYNDANMPPWELPANKTQSGIETRSSKPGLNAPKAKANIFRFEDLADKEVIYMHAQKDHLVEVEHDEDITIDHDQTRHIKNDQTLKVDNNQTETIKQNRKLEITQGNDTYHMKTGNLKEDIDKGNQTTKLGMGNRDTTLSMGNDSLKMSLGKQNVEAMQSIELKVGQSSVKLDQMGVTIKGMMIKIEGQVMVDVKGLMTSVKGSAMLTLKGGITMIN